MERKYTPESNQPALSFVLCSRNDSYMGNSVWRLQTAINYVAKAAHDLKRLQEIEIVVADWGSKTPLHNALNLSCEAKQIISFVEIPPEVAIKEQGDSPFPEVIALNTAARRTSGLYIGRIDQDTLVGKNFLQFFFSMYDDPVRAPFALDNSFLFSGRRGIPYDFASRCPSFATVERFVETTKNLLPIDGWWIRPWWNAFVGVMLMHRNLWFEAAGYDERLIYWGWMECDLGYRLSQRHELVNLGPLVGYDFYHLEHAKHRTVGNSRRRNQERHLDLEYAPNGESWGLNSYDLDFTTYEPVPTLSNSGNDDKSVDSRAILEGWRALPGCIFMSQTEFLQMKLQGRFFSIAHALKHGKTPPSKKER